MATKRPRCKTPCTTHTTKLTTSKAPTSPVALGAHDQTSTSSLEAQLAELQRRFKEAQLDSHAARKQLQQSNQRIGIVMANLDAERDANARLQHQIETLNARHVDVLEENHVLRVQLRHNSAGSELSATSDGLDSPLEIALLRRESEDSIQAAEELEEQVCTLVEELEDRERDLEDVRRELESLRAGGSCTSSCSSHRTNSSTHAHLPEQPFQVTVNEAGPQVYRHRRNALIPEPLESDADCHQHRLKARSLAPIDTWPAPGSVDPSMPGTPADQSEHTFELTDEDSYHKHHENDGEEEVPMFDGAGLKGAKKLPRP